MKINKFSSTFTKLFTALAMVGIVAGSALADDDWKNPMLKEFPTEVVNTTGLTVDDNYVTVGQLHSVTGTMAISETGSVEAERLAIKQINDMGGILRSDN